jgi:hypothetical protein
MILVDRDRASTKPAILTSRLALTGLLAFGVMSLTTSCATTAPQSEAVLRVPPKGLAQNVQISNVPFIEQEAGQCGPASLTMAMHWAGNPITVDKLLPEVMTPEKKGSLQQDLISASRREGMMAVQTEGMPSLLEELAAGHPVIIFENLGLTWYQQWHYAVVTGYDLSREEFIMHSGHEANERIDMKIFERSWKLSDYWSLVVLPPGKTAASAGELGNMQAAAGLEQAGREKEAANSYQAILNRWPSSLSALIGLANIAYKDRNFISAVSLLKQAKLAHPESAVVDHNLKVAEAAAFRK